MPLNFYWFPFNPLNLCSTVTLIKFQEMSATTNIYLPLQFNQLVDLIKALPKKEKQQLLDVLQQDEPADIPEWQKQEVRKRIGCRCWC